MNSLQGALPYIGNPDQIISFSVSRFEEGRARGTRIASISTPAGLDATVVCDRCMDLYNVRYKGINLNYITPVGIAAPQYYDASGAGWLRNFFGGFLTSCGLRNIGSPDSYGGESFGLHGRLSNIPAEQLSYSRDGGGVRLSGVMTEACAFGEAFTLRREYFFPAESGSEAEFFFEDCVTNVSHTARPFMQLYHFNIGYPFLCESSVPVIKSKKIVPRDEYAALHAENYSDITSPVDEYREMCYYHTLEKDENGVRSFGMKNSALGLSLEISFDDFSKKPAASALDVFVQWKMFQKGAYVMGLEPANATLDGYEENIRNGTLKTLAPGESAKRRFSVKIKEEK
ncbi:MAG: aldose 1-epimerase family protein [Oscillospiraceae bacterium]|nr:aldose 1-epimerase family protein [Oscillospiraceae bacterium]